MTPETEFILVILMGGGLGLLGLMFFKILGDGIDSELPHGGGT